MSTLKVLFVSRKWPPAVGGMETYSLELTRELSALCSLETLTLSGKKDGGSPSAFALAGFLLQAWLHIWRTRRQYDVIHLGDCVLHILGWWAKRVSPTSKVVVTVHGLDIIYGRRAGIAAQVYDWYLRLASRCTHIDQYIANSANTQKLAAEYGLMPCTSVPLGVRLEGPLLEPGTLKRQVLFLGRIVARKGAAWFATEVLPLLSADIAFLVVGKVWDEDEGKILAGNPRVEMLGFQPDAKVRELKRQTPVMVMPNQPSEDSGDVEGFGLASLEATADGIPLIASAIEGISDAIEDGVTGFLLPPDDPKAWAAKIEEILLWSDEKRSDFARTARTCLEDRYTWHRVAVDTYKAYTVISKPN